jgi:ankyrin repeat protein
VISWDSAFASRLIAMSDPAPTVGMACMEGDVKALRELLKGGLSVNATEQHGVSPLHIACGEGHAGCAELLCCAGADLDCCNNAEGISPLSIACFRSRTECVKVLLEAKARPDLPDLGGITPLHVAASNGRIEIVAMLLAAGAPPSPVEWGSGAVCPLYGASAGGHHEVVQMLLAAGASPNGVEGAGHMPPLAIASVRNHTSIVRMLCRAGAELPPKLIDGDSSMNHPLATSRFSTAGQLIAAASRPWSPANHELFPDESQRLARELLYVGTQLARTLAVTEEIAFFDVWRQDIMPMVIERQQWVATIPLGKDVTKDCCE